MPVHDWTRVGAGIFHDFHHAWIEELKRTLNSGILPSEYYALSEQFAAGFGPDVLTLQTPGNGLGDTPTADAPQADGASLLLAPPRAKITAETEMEFYRRKQSSVVVRHAAGDRIVSVLEVVSSGNKASGRAMRSLLDKVAGLLDQRIHLLILDLHPPTPRDPHGIHAAIWEDISGEEQIAPEKPLTLAAYESALTVRAYVEPLAVGDPLVDMPLFLEPGAHVLVPLEAAYQHAFEAVPRRWRAVLDQPR